MRLTKWHLVSWLSILPLACASEPSGYVGFATCGQCHRAIAAVQAKSNMAQTWQGGATHLLPSNYRAEHAEGSGPANIYRASRTARSGLEFEASLPGHAPVKAPVEQVVGGERHGLSFLARVRNIEGAKLARAPLVETRYLHSTHENALVLSPGFPEERPSSYESLVGRALSPSFEKKCLDCHGQPEAAGAAGGVHCESCHGPGRAHLESVAAGKPHAGIANIRPSIDTCAHCHSGFSVLSDPIPDDLLISNQVNALKNSECYVQSAGRIGCMSCHDPHQDSPSVAAKSVQTCLGCHNSRVEAHAGLCPVNREGKCIECHMPGVTKGSFTMVDHWIGVHPEQRIVGSRHLPEWKTQVRPRRVFLRIIVTDVAKAELAQERLRKREPFFDVAREMSLDPSSTGGGYLGEMWIDRMDTKLADAASALAPGEVSPPIDVGTRRIILQRLPRDFRWQADQLQREASALKAKGLLAEAADKYQEALRVYPQFLRALIFLGATLGQQGNGERALGILEFAARLYPDDPAARYNLGIAYGALGRAPEEIAAYRRAIEIEPDLVPAYQNLGAALYSAGQPENAIEIYRRGLDVNPLTAVLYYNMGVIQRDRGETDKANAAIAVARKIDPEFVSRQEGVR